MQVERLLGIDVERALVGEDLQRRVIESTRAIGCSRASRARRAGPSAPSIPSNINRKSAPPALS